MSPNFRGYKLYCHNTGSSMIEVLVTTVILAIGLLGVAGLQTTSLRQGNSLQTDLQLQVLAQDLMERAMAFEDLDGTGLFNKTTVPKSEPERCSESYCSRAQIVAYELWAWSSRVKSELPSGSYDLDFKAGEYRLAMTWDHDGDGKVTKPGSDDCKSVGGADDCFFVAFRVR